MNDAEFLKHYGVLGMKWGVRRRSKGPNSSDYDKVRELKKKRISELSDAELKLLSNRLQLEKQYQQLNPTTRQKGQKLVKEVVGGPVKVIAKELVTNYLKQNGNKLMDQAIATAKKAKGK